MILLRGRDNGINPQIFCYAVFSRTATSLDIVSPYFVPAVVGTRALVAMGNRGVKVRVLTNSLAATDVTAVHAGYAKRRKRLLKAGVELFELPRTRERELAGPLGSSAASLHAKTFAIDGQRLFIGSFNFDPRSANLNTEMGFLIESPPLAQTLHSSFRGGVVRHAYRVRLDTGGDVYWLRRENGQIERYESEPDTTWLRRNTVWLLSLLPIDWLL